MPAHLQTSPIARHRRCSFAILALGLLLGVASLSAAEPAKEPLLAVEQGAIFPASRAAVEAIVPGLDPREIQSYWTPTPEIVAALESRLAAFLDGRAAQDRADLARVPWLERSKSALAADQKHVSNIRGRLPDTRRQYVGVVVGGARRVFVNCFPRESFPDWDRQFVFVLDGGDWFWSVQYDVDAESFLALAFNGEA